MSTAPTPLGLGVTELAVTEHCSRFGQFDQLLRGWWDRDPSPARRSEMAKCWDEELGGDLDQYVETVLAAKAAGLPVVVGLEVDYFPDQMDQVAALLGNYPFDVLLGSVHWIGAWLFDALEWAKAQEQWSARGVDRVWDDYTRSVEELAACGAVDVLAHPDLAKVAGHRPGVPDEFYDRIAEAARSSGLAAELNSSGWRKPCAEAYPALALLSRFHNNGVPITTASDGHELGSRVLAGRRPGCNGKVGWVLRGERVPGPQPHALAAVMRSATRILRRVTEREPIRSSAE